MKFFAITFLFLTCLPHDLAADIPSGLPRNYKEVISDYVKSKNPRYSSFVICYYKPARIVWKKCDGNEAPRPHLVCVKIRWMSYSSSGALLNMVVFENLVFQYSVIDGSFDSKDFDWIGGE